MIIGFLMQDAQMACVHRGWNKRGQYTLKRLHTWF
jgi:hypothetical protein